MQRSFLLVEGETWRLSQGRVSNNIGVKSIEEELLEHPVERRSSAEPRTAACTLVQGST